MQAEWIQLQESHQHAVFVGTISNPDFAALGTNVVAFMPPMIKGIRESAKGFVLVDSRPLTICNGRSGYFLRYQDHRARPVDVTIVFGLSHNTLFAAFYEHDLGSPAFPAGLTSIKSLCPPPEASPS